MSLQAVQERLSQLQETTAHLRTLIDHLANFKLQPSSVSPGPHGAEDGEGQDQEQIDSDACAELSSDITQGLRESEEDLDLLREEIADLRAGRVGSEAEQSKTRLMEAVSRLEQELKSSRVSFRKAQLSARKRLAAAQRAERVALIASYAAPPTNPSSTNRSGASSPGPGQQQQQPQHLPRRKQHRVTADDDPSSSSSSQVVGAAHDVTASLRRTHDLMASELARSAYAAQALAESTAALASLDERYSGLDGMLAASRDLLGTLLKSQKSDTWYLQTSLYVLLATAAWLVFRRFLYGPLFWLVWTPLRLVWWGAGKGVGIAIPGTKGGVGEGVVVVGTGLTSPSASSVGGSTGSMVSTARGQGVVSTVSVVGQGGEESPASLDPDSMIEKVGKIVDGEGRDDGSSESQENAEAARDGGGQDKPNPKKRMWEEPAEAAKHADAVSASGQGQGKPKERGKDEL